jgi:hypothetical protein
MRLDMPKILLCDATVCAFNKNEQCHAFAITVGDGVPAMCDTSIISDKEGGLAGIQGGVGACKVESCKFNKYFECSAPGIRVQLHTDHADCVTYSERDEKQVA